jgi:hypothetical protein
LTTGWILSAPVTAHPPRSQPQTPCLGAPRTCHAGCWRDTAGRIGLSENHARELIAVPLADGQSVYVLENQFCAPPGPCSTGISAARPTSGSTRAAASTNTSTRPAATTIGSPPLAAPACCCSTRRATSLSATSPRPNQSWSSRVRRCTGKRASRFPCTWSTCVPRAPGTGATRPLLDDLAAPRRTRPGGRAVRSQAGGGDRNPRLPLLPHHQTMVTPTLTDKNDPVIRPGQQLAFVPRLAQGPGAPAG